MPLRLPLSGGSPITPTPTPTPTPSTNVILLTTSSSNNSATEHAGKVLVFGVSGTSTYNLVSTVNWSVGQTIDLVNRCTGNLTVVSADPKHVLVHSQGTGGRTVWVNGSARLVVISKAVDGTYQSVLTGDLNEETGHVTALAIDSLSNAILKPEYFGKRLNVWGSVNTFDITAALLSGMATPYFTVEIVNLSETIPLQLTWPLDGSVNYYGANGDRIAPLGKACVGLFSVNVVRGPTLPTYYLVVTGDLVGANGVPTKFTDWLNITGGVAVDIGQPIQPLATENPMMTKDSHRNRTVTWIGDYTGGNFNWEYSVRPDNMTYTDGMALFEIHLVNLSSRPLDITTGTLPGTVAVIETHDTNSSTLQVKSHGMARLRLVRLEAPFIITDPELWGNVTWHFLLSGDLV